jgi:pectin methylesterase-like acyl-CoA thioesterase
MADAYTPTDGLKNVTSFPTDPADETAARKQVQDVLDQMLAFHNTHLADLTAHATTANITYYIRTDGSDSNTGLINSAAGAFLTIQHAIDVLPQTINHTVIINVAAGTYAETVTISGFIGKGTIGLYGPDLLNDTYMVNNIIIKYCGISETLRGLKCLSTSAANIDVSYSKFVTMSKMKCVEADASHAAIGISTNSAAYINGCELSNRLYGIVGLTTARVSSNTNAGTGNTYGLYASAATIMKSGAQPAGTTAEGLTMGGVIR